MISQNRSMLTRAKTILKGSKNSRIHKINISMSFSYIKEDSRLTIQIFRLKNQKFKDTKDTTRAKLKEHNLADLQI